MVRENRFHFSQDLLYFDIKLKINERYSLHHLRE